MTGIILSIVAIIGCLIAFIISVANSEIISAIVMLLLVFITIYNICNEPPKNQTTVVKDIQGFSVDTALTISGTDTIKTYTLTYWK